MPEYKGIDMSTWQGKAVDWDRVKAAGVQFAMLRCGFTSKAEGVCTLDNTFERNAAEANRVGIPIGAYYYTLARTPEKALEEARFTLAAVKPFRLEYPIAFDLEDGELKPLDRTTLSNLVIAYCNEIELGGYYAMLYSNPDWLVNKLDYDRIKRFDLWLAQWASKATYSNPFGMWQYTSSGAVDGIPGAVDMNIAYKDYAANIKNGGLNHLENLVTSPSPTAPGTIVTGAELAEKCIAQTGACYVWGGLGYTLTESRLTQLKALYPSHYTEAYLAKCRKNLGKNAFDCAGLIKHFLWGNTGDGVLRHYGTNGIPDTTANGMRDLCTETGDASALPELEGLLLWQDGHVGVYLGGGKAVEARGVDYGVVVTDVAARGWKKWGELPGVAYVEAEQTGKTITWAELGDRLRAEGYTHVAV